MITFTLRIKTNKKVLILLSLLLLCSVALPQKKGKMTDPRDGHVYKTVKIGEQVWMAENLNYKMPEAYVYKYSTKDNKKIKKKYRLLYTWEAALIACPNGWHLASDEEWKELEMSLGMSKSEADRRGIRGYGEGEKLKSTKGWKENGNGNGSNSSGFNAMPAGRYTDGIYDNVGMYSYFWTSTPSNEWNVWTRQIRYLNTEIVRSGSISDNAYSCRCVQD